MLWAGKVTKVCFYLHLLLICLHSIYVSNSLKKKKAKETELLISFTTACRSDCLLILNNEVISFPIPLAGMFSKMEWKANEATVAIGEWKHYLFVGCWINSIYKRVWISLKAQMLVGLCWVFFFLKMNAIHYALHQIVKNTALMRLGPCSTLQLPFKKSAWAQAHCLWFGVSL